MHFSLSVGKNPFLHSIGLSLVKSLVDKWLYPVRGASEHRKTVLDQNVWRALQRCTVHAISVVTSIVLCYVNVRGVYLGGELPGKSGQDNVKLGALQFAVKLHELSIHASIAAILFTYIRNELLSQKGIPFGALTAGLQFTDISYLW